MRPSTEPGLLADDLRTHHSSVRALARNDRHDVAELHARREATDLALEIEVVAAPTAPDGRRRDL
jgi:hypothetical protein